MTTPTTNPQTSGVYYRDDTLTLLLGDAGEQLRTLPERSVHCVVTSPPYYGLRDYAAHPDQIGLEATPAEYITRLVGVFADVRRVLADDGTLWLNLGDTYSRGNGQGNSGPTSTLQGGARPSFRQDGASVAPAGIRRGGLPGKNLLGMPWQVALALQESGWFLRNAIVWHKPNAMPESVRDRLSTRYELLFLLAKNRQYWFDLDPIRENLAYPADALRPRARESRGAPDWKQPQQVKLGSARHAVTDCRIDRDHQETAENGRNPGDVWSIATTPLPDAHFAAFPVELPRRCILAGCKPGGTVLDPFSGAGTTALAAQQLGRRAIGVDLVADYHDIALQRMANAPLPLEHGGSPA